MRRIRLSLGSACILFCAGLIVAGSIGSCSFYRLVISEPVPLPETEQAAGMQVSDDGTVTFVKERLEISIRPMTDEELNRQFAAHSDVGRFSTNPYTYGNWKDPETGRPPTRFTVFSLKVKNYTYPKMKVDPLKAIIITANGRRYSSLSIHQIEEYYRPYAVGYAGNAYARYEARKDILKESLYAGDVVFSGQEASGYVVFPKLYKDVEQITLWLKDIALRFDFRDEPVETLDAQFLFRRDIERVSVTHSSSSRVDQ
ncbi:MAG: hypothetical protein J7M27_11960 [Candidatus Latescibacteria bacterium]|nr:hypothetical protein [Candidatus Latescibacterota bacterium]